MLHQFLLHLHLHISSFCFSFIHLVAFVVEMDEESAFPVSMPGNSVSKIEDKGQQAEATKIGLNHQIEYHVDYSFCEIVQTTIYAPFYLSWMFLAAIIFPNKPQYFIYSSFVPMLLDPLFLYIPLVNEENKCLVLDKRVMTAALILRVCTDLRYAVKIIFKIYNRLWGNSKRLGIKTNVLAILPIPQVVMLVYIPNMRGSGSLIILRCLNWLIFFQYLQRVYPIYRHCKNLNKEILDKNTHMRACIPSLVNLLIYLLASYVLGTFWYYFSIQREFDCWEHACRREVGCEFSIQCNVRTFRNVTLLHMSCPINPPDPTKFDFGIFLIALQSGMQESTNFPQKVLLCFSWGLRNLSSFGSNLNTSHYFWETLFVVGISISGLIFFIYFLGHMQTFMQVTGKAERSRQKLEKILGPKVESMLLEYGFPTDSHVLKDNINHVVEQKHSEEPDFVLENLFSVFSFKHKVDGQNLQRLNAIRITIFFEKIKQLDFLLGIHSSETVLKELCKHLDPVIYLKGSYIIREGEPVDMMFIITQGIALAYSSDQSMPTRLLETGDYYGKELLIWATMASTSFSDLPNSAYTVKAHKDVEVFAVQAADVRMVFSKPSFGSSRFI